MEKRRIQLNLHREWFDMILANEKKEEYRAITPYWSSRLLRVAGERKSREWWEEFYAGKGEKGLVVELIQFDEILFSNGYAKDRDQFIAEVKRTTIGIGRPKWGAEEGKEYFTFKLGRITVLNVKKRPPATLVKPTKTKIV